MTDYMPVRSIYGKTRVPYYVAKIFSKSHSNTSGLYNAGSVWKEAELFKYLRGSRNETSIVHYLNAERDIRYFLKYKKLFPNIKFCGTFHKPPDVLNRTIKNFGILSKLDGAIAVGENQVEFLKESLQLENIAFIPHGVDTDFFKPDLSKKEPKTLIFVGSHLRDFEVLNYCIPRIADIISNLKVNVIIKPTDKAKITDHKSITVHSNISDIELRDLYNCSTLLFLPMKNSTACNSILEGLACGLPVVTTDIGGNRFYLEGTKNVLVPKGDNNYYIEAVISMLSNPENLQLATNSSREKALTLSWEEITRKVGSFYENMVQFKQVGK